MTTTRIACVALLVLWLSSCSGEADFSGSVETATLDSEAYKQEILEIDRLVFASTKMDDARRKALEDQLEKLATRVAGEKPATFMKLESLELRALAKRAGRAGSARSMTDLENQWMRIRANLFDDQWWYARSAADLEATATMLATAAPEEAGPPLGTAEPARIAPPVAATKVTESAAPPNYAPLPLPGEAGLPAGRWDVEAIFANGEPSGDPEMTGAEWRFDDGTLSIVSATGTERYALELHGESARLRAIDAPSTTPREGWMLLRRREGVLHAAFHDNLKGRPASFLHEPGSEQLLIVVVLRKR